MLRKAEQKFYGQLILAVRMERAEKKARKVDQRNTALANLKARALIAAQRMAEAWTFAEAEEAQREICAAVEAAAEL